MSEAVEFGDKSDADRFRDEYANYRCPVDDDKRTRTVHFTSDTPAEILEEARSVAEAGFADREAREAKPGNRELTESEKRGLDFSRDGVSYVKAKALANVAEEYGVSAFEHVDVAEVDTTDDARPIFERARRSGGTGRGGGTAQYDDEAAEREDRQQRQRGERQAGEACNHARGKCRSGESEACEYLQERCGLSEDEATSLLAEQEPAGEEAADASESEPWIPTDKWGDLSGSERGAVSRAAGGYHGATEKMRASLAGFMAAFEDAQAAAKALNGMRARVGEGPLHFDALEAANAALLDTVRHTARRCSECHADHGDDDHSEHAPHDVTDGEREDLRAFVSAGGQATAVGNPDGIGPARSAAEHPDEAVANREPKPGDREVPERPPERAGSDDAAAEAGEASEQFAAERQQTLAGEGAATEDKQFTLTGGDASNPNEQAIPAVWNGGGIDYTAGPYKVVRRAVEGSYVVRLKSPHDHYTVARNIPTEDDASAVQDEFVNRLAPEEVSFHSDDAAVPEAAAAAKRAVDYSTPEGQATLQ